MKKWLRVKRLVNDGELSKAARDIDGAGVAEPTDEVIAELRLKYPKRSRDVKWPQIGEIMTELKKQSRIDQLEKLKTSDEDNSVDSKKDNPLATVATTLDIDDDEAEMEIEDKDDDFTSKDRHDWDPTDDEKRWLEENNVHTRISHEDITKAAMRIKRSTGACHQQITPWMLRQAIESSTNGSCSLAIAKLSNRMAKGDFDRVSGRAFSMMRSFALWTDKEKSR